MCFKTEINHCLAVRHNAYPLHIHKNTVSYRMQRMIELFDLDLKDCRLITALYLSLFADYEAKS